LQSKEILEEARRALGIEQIVLVIHDASFPSRSDEDTGRGSPYTRGARDLLGWARDQGFTGLQLGPQGETSATNPSPYDGTAFSRSVLSVALWPLAHDPKWEGILEPSVVDAVVKGAPAARRARGSERVDYAYAYAAQRRALREAHRRLGRCPGVLRRFTQWRQENAWWVDHDALYDAFALLYGTDDWGAWPVPPTPERIDAEEVEFFVFGQFVAHAQHAELVAWAGAHELALFGDLQVGIAVRDRFERQACFLPGYAMGAPPSRTNPEGQPWGYPVFNPHAVEAIAFLRARMTKLLSEFHGVRIDHPHGLVCPWVYKAAAPDPIRAVNAGARLFESPDLPDHPALARWAIARPDQIDRRALRYADHWVKELDEAQIDAYARRIDVIMDAVRACGRSDRDVVCEVLSTCPYPLEQVMRRYGLGRFRVTQKADPLDETDGYLTSRAERADWAMLGNHDTPPIWEVVHAWSEARTLAWCAYLEARLGADAIDRRLVRADRAELAQPMLADLFVCDAAHVAIFFPDLMGARETYNVPGLVSDTNWTLRIGNDFIDAHRARLAVGRALSLPRALATALRARDRREDTALHADLAARVEKLHTA
jgi:4-alpha-glucanotransferase